MAKKKKPAQKNDQFKNSPFKDLKGLRASVPTGGETGSRKAPEASSKKHKEDVPANDMECFRSEMERMEVDRFRGDEDELQNEDLPKSRSVVSSVSEPDDDEAQFLKAMGQMDTCFRDEYPQEDEERQASPRRMKQVRQGRLVPEAKLDLHGLTRDEAKARVRFFLDDSTYQGLKTVLIVTGRGMGSKGEPVLRNEIERYLSLEAKAWVVEWGRAPRQYGGEGALIAFLKSRRN